MAKSKKADGREAEKLFTGALVELIEVCPPEGFNIVAFQTLRESGHLFDATALIHKYITTTLSTRPLDKNDAEGALVLSPYGDVDNNQVVITRIPYETELLTFQESFMHVGFHKIKRFPSGWYRTKLLLHYNSVIQAIDPYSLDVRLFDKDGEIITTTTMYRRGNKRPYQLILPNDYLAARVAAGEGEMIPPVPVVCVDAKAIAEQITNNLPTDNLSTNNY